MRTGTNKKLILSVLALAAALLLTGTVVFAWFVSDTKRSLLATLGDSEVQAALYLGNDGNYDGILEPSDAALPEGTRAEFLKKYYTQLEREPVEWKKHENLIVGNCVTFKVIALNPAESTYDADVRVSFAQMERYVFDAVPEDGSIPAAGWADKVFRNHSTRLLFRTDGVRVRVYRNAGEGTGGFEEGFAEEQEGRAPGEISGRPLWELSRGETAAGNVRIMPGELAELDFQLTYVQLTLDVSTAYLAYAREHYPAAALSKFSGGGRTEAEALAFAQAYFEAFVQAEVRYLQDLTASEGTAMSDSFLLERIYVTGTQLPGGEGA